MSKKRVMQWLKIVVSAIVVVGILGTGAVLIGNHFRFTETQLRISVPSGELEGVLTLPREGDPRGLAIIVHGDAAVTATHDGLYAPWFESAADAGYATISWSKRGVGGSAGNWLDQSLTDRATEVSEVIDWAKTQNNIPTDRIVLWGASQAGWVLPQVVHQRDDIDGVVAVGTAINWLDQGRFNLLAELDYSSATPQERTAAIKASDETRAMLERGASHEEYLAVTQDDPPMTADRWAFVARNMYADATEDLAKSATAHIPILLLVGEHDRNVDVAETEAVYREIFGADLSVLRVDAVHSMARPIIDSNEPLALATAVFWPRALLAPEALDGYRDFLIELE